MNDIDLIDLQKHITSNIVSLDKDLGLFSGRKWDYAISFESGEIFIFDVQLYRYTYNEYNLELLSAPENLKGARLLAVEVSPWRLATEQEAAWDSKSNINHAADITILTSVGLVTMVLKNSFDRSEDAGVSLKCKIRKRGQTVGYERVLDEASSLEEV